MAGISGATAVKIDDAIKPDAPTIPTVQGLWSDSAITQTPNHWLRYATNELRQPAITSPRHIAVEGINPLRVDHSQVVVTLITLQADNIQVRAKWQVSNALNAFAMEEYGDGELYLTVNLEDMVLSATVYLEDEFSLLNTVYNNLQAATTIRVEIMAGMVVSLSIIKPRVLYAAEGVAEIVHIFMPQGGTGPYEYIPADVPDGFGYEQGTLSIHTTVEENEYLVTVKIADAVSMTATVVATVIVEAAASVQIQGDGGAVFISQGQEQDISDTTLFNPKSSAGVLVSAMTESTVALMAPGNTWAITLYGGTQASFAGGGAGAVVVSLAGDSDFGRDTAAEATVSLTYVFSRNGTVAVIVPVTPMGTRIFNRSWGGEWYLIIDEGEAEFTPRPEVNFLALNDEVAWWVNGQKLIVAQTFTLAPLVMTVAHGHTGEVGPIIANYGVAPSFSVTGMILPSARIGSEYYPQHSAQLSLAATPGPLTVTYTVVAEDYLGDILGSYGYINQLATATVSVVVNAPLSLMVPPLSAIEETVQRIHTLTASGGYAPYTYTLILGNDNGYFSINEDVLLISIAAVGMYTLVIRVDDEQGVMITTQITVVVKNTPLSAQLSENFIRALGENESKVLGLVEAFGGSGNYVFSLLNSYLSGNTYTFTGEYSFALSGGQCFSTINNLADGTFHTGQGEYLSASGGNCSFKFVVGRNLPAGGLVLGGVTLIDANGQVTSAGSSHFTVKTTSHTPPFSINSNTGEVRAEAPLSLPEELTIQVRDVNSGESVILSIMVIAESSLVANFVGEMANTHESEVLRGQGITLSIALPVPALVGGFVVSLAMMSDDQNYTVTVLGDDNNITCENNTCAVVIAEGQSVALLSVLTANDLTLSLVFGGDDDFVIMVEQTPPPLPTAYFAEQNIDVMAGHAATISLTLSAPALVGGVSLSLTIISDGQNYTVTIVGDAHMISCENNTCAVVIAEGQSVALLSVLTENDLILSLVFGGDDDFVIMVEETPIVPDTPTAYFADNMAVIAADDVLNGQGVTLSITLSVPALVGGLSLSLTVISDSDQYTITTVGDGGMISCDADVCAVVVTEGQNVVQLSVFTPNDITLSLVIGGSGDFVIMVEETPIVPDTPTAYFAESMAVIAADDVLSGQGITLSIALSVPALVGGLSLSLTVISDNNQYTITTVGDGSTISCDADACAVVVAAGQNVVQLSVFTPTDITLSLVVGGSGDFVIMVEETPTIPDTPTAYFAESMAVIAEVDVLSGQGITLSITLSVPALVGGLSLSLTVISSSDQYTITTVGDGSTISCDADACALVIAEGQNVVQLSVFTPNHMILSLVGGSGDYVVIHTWPAVCLRTPQVQEAITEQVNKPCEQVTDDDLATITNLDVRSDNINSLHQGDFAGLSDLRSLDLAGNALTTLPMSVFAGLSNLQYLNLDGNALTTLPVSVFADLSNLRDLDLNNNALTTLPMSVFANLSNLQYLFLHNNALTTLPMSVFAGLTNLEFLVLKNNDLTILPVSVFADLSNLRDLDLRDNALTTLPVSVFADLSNLRNLGLEGNALPTLPVSVFANLSNLQYLFLNNNALTTLPVSVFADLSNLRFLYLRDNALTTLPMSVFAGLSNLLLLDLSGNACSFLGQKDYLGIVINTILNVVITDVDYGIGLSCPTLNQAQVASFVTSGAILSRAQIATNDGIIIPLTLNSINDTDNFTVTVTVLNGSSDHYTVAIVGDDSAGSCADDQCTLIIPPGHWQASLSVFTQTDLVLSMVAGGRDEFLIMASPLIYFAGPMTISQASDVFTGQGLTLSITLSAPALASELLLSFTVISDDARYTIAVVDDDDSITCANDVCTLVIATGKSESLLNVLTRNNITLSLVGGNDDYAVLNTWHDVCGRAAPVQQAITEDVEKSCALITDTDLAGIGNIYVNNSNINSLHEGDFDGLTGLEELRLQNNHLTTLPMNVFADLTQLQELRLQGNKLTALPISVFADLTQLTDLRLHSNNLTALPISVFAGLTQLTNLELQTNSCSFVGQEEYLGITYPISNLNLGTGTACPTLNEAQVANFVSSITLLSRAQIAIHDGAIIPLTLNSVSDVENSTVVLTVLGRGSDNYTVAIVGDNIAGGCADDQCTLIMPPWQWQVSLTALAQNDLVLSVVADGGDEFIILVERIAAFAEPMTIIQEAAVLDGHGATIDLTLSAPALAGGLSLSLTIISERGQYTVTVLGDENTISCATDICAVVVAEGQAMAQLSVLTRNNMTLSLAVGGRGDFALMVSPLAYFVGGMTINQASNVYIGQGITLSITLSAPALADGLSLSLTVIDDYAQYFITVVGDDNAITCANDTCALVIAAGQTAVLLSVLTPNDLTLSLVGGSGDYAAINTWHDVCGRTQQVQNAIMAEAGTPCEQITDTDLAGIDVLNMAGGDINSLHAGDFAGLTELETLLLNGNNLTTLPMGIFAGLTQLTWLDLQNNACSFVGQEEYLGLTHQISNLNLGTGTICPTLNEAQVANFVGSITLLSRAQIAANDGAIIPLTLNSINDTDNFTVALTVLGGHRDHYTVTIVGDNIAVQCANDQCTLIIPPGHWQTSLSVLAHNDLVLSMVVGGDDEFIILVERIAAFAEHMMIIEEAAVLDGHGALISLTLSAPALGGGLSLSLTIISERDQYTVTVLGDGHTISCAADICAVVVAAGQTGALLSVLTRNNMTLSLAVGGRGDFALRVSPLAYFAGSMTISQASDVYTGQGITLSITLLAPALADGLSLSLTVLSDHGPYLITVLGDNDRITCANDICAVVVAAGQTGALLSVLTPKELTLSLVGSSGDYAVVNTWHDVCRRTAQVRDKITTRFATSCESITDIHLADLTNLNMGNGGVSSLHVGDFADLTGLQNLDLNNNQLTMLSENIFADLTSLEELGLRGNTLTALPFGIFAGLTNLQILHLENNKLIALPMNIFADLTGLQNLWLNGNVCSFIGQEDYLGIAADNFIYGSGVRCPTLDQAQAATFVSNTTILSRAQIAINHGTIISLTLNSVSDVDNFTVALTVRGGHRDHYILTIIGDDIAGSCADDFCTLIMPPWQWQASLTVLAQNDLVVSVVADGGDEFIVWVERLAAFAEPMTIIQEAAALDGHGATIDLTLSAPALAGGLSLSLTIMSERGQYTVTVVGDDNTISCANDLCAVMVAAGQTVAQLSVLTRNNITLSLVVGGHGDFALMVSPLAYITGPITIRQASDIVIDGLTLSITLSAPALAGGLSLSLTVQSEDAYHITVVNDDNSITCAHDTCAVVIAGGQTEALLRVLTPNHMTLSLVGSSGDYAILDTWHDVCRRTAKVRDAIRLALGNKSCGSITDTDLATFIFGLALDEEDITSLREGDFAGLTNLQNLDLHSNQLTTLPKNIFADLTNLEELYLYENALTALPISVFAGLTKLQRLSLGDNKLTALPMDVFADLTKLEILWLYGNLLAALPNGIFDNVTNLTVLHVERNFLTTLPNGIFDNLTNLKAMGFSTNLLATLPRGIFDNLTKLTNLNLWNNKLSSLPFDIFHNSTNLESIALSDNNLSFLFSDIFAGLTELKILHLYGNGCSFAGQEEHLGITHTIPDLNLGTGDSCYTYSRRAYFVGGFKLLSTTQIAQGEGTIMTINLNPPLSSSSDPFTIILTVYEDYGIIETATVIGDNNYGSCTQTRCELVISPGQGQIQLSVFSSTDLVLEILKFADYSVTDVWPHVCTRTTKVEDEIEDIVGKDCWKITGADLAGITFLDLLGDVTSLREGDFDGLTNLQHLVLAFNNLSTLPPGIFAGLTNLRRLRLEVNLLTTLPSGIFDDSTNLEELYLHDGNLSTLPPGIFAGLTNLQYLNLQGNSCSFANQNNYLGINHDIPNAYFGSGSACIPDPRAASFVSNVALSTTQIAQGEGAIITIALNYPVPPSWDPFIISLTVRYGSMTDARVIGDNNYGSCTQTGCELTISPGQGQIQLSVLTDTDLVLDIVAGGSGRGVIDVWPHVCTRTQEVQDEIVAQIGKPCWQVTGADLASWTYMDLLGDGVTSLQEGDFDGMTNLRTMDLGDNKLTALPAGIFADLTKLENIWLYGNTLYALPNGIFDDLTNLTNLNIDRSRLSTLPQGIFDNLTNLQGLSLDRNRLSSLPPGIFYNLTNLQYLRLYSNNLSSLSPVIFNNLINLEFLYLHDNNLSSLPAGIFNNLTNLQWLYLYDNNLSSLPAGIFANLTVLEVLRLDGNSCSFSAQKSHLGIGSSVAVNLGGGSLCASP